MRYVAFTALMLAVLVNAAPGFADDKTPMPSLPVPPGSDDVTAKQQADDFLGQAKDAYKEGHYRQAQNLVDKAQIAIRTKRAELYKALLPAASGEWKVDDNADKRIVFGFVNNNNSNVSRTYTGYGHTVKISYLIDPQTMGMMRPFISPGDQDSSPEEVKGYQAIYKDSSSQQINPAFRNGTAHQLTIYEGDVVAVIQSDTLPKSTMMEFANAIDFAKIKAVQ
jgi:hypothetical protein